MRVSTATSNTGECEELMGSNIVFYSLTKYEVTNTKQQNNCNDQVCFKELTHDTTTVKSEMFLKNWRNIGTYVKAT